MRRWQRLDDDMEAMCGDVLVSFDGDRKPPTQRDGSKSASRRVGVPASAARLRRCPDPDCRLGSLRFVDALVPSIFQDMAERFPVISTDIYKSCQRKQERVGPLCLEPRRPNLRLSVDRGDGEVVSRTCRRQMTQGCIFATKMSSLVTESRRVFLARLKQLRRNENGGRHEMCYFGVALMLASPDHDDPPASTAQAARPPPVVKGRHRQRHSVALPWLARVRHSSAVGADHEPTARSHSWDAKENLCRSLWLMSIVGWESCEKISGKRLFWELPRLGGRETEKHRFAAYSHLPLTACTSCFFGKGRIRRSMEFGRKGAMEFAPVQTDVPSMRPLGASHFCKPSSPDRNCKDKKEKEEINGNRNRRTMPELLPTPRVGGSSPCSAQPQCRTDGSRHRVFIGAVQAWSTHAAAFGTVEKKRWRIRFGVRPPLIHPPSLALPLLPHHYGLQLIDSPAPPNSVSAKTWSLPLAIGREGGCCKTWRRVDQSLIPPRDTGPAPQATSDVEIRAQPVSLDRTRCHRYRIVDGELRQLHLGSRIRTPSSISHGKM